MIKDEVFKHKAEMILRWRNLSWLEPMYTSTHSIPERIYQYNQNLFVVRNLKTETYEIHSIEQGPGAPSKQCDVPYDELDVRTLHFLWEQDIRVHGDEIFKRIERSEEKAKQRNKKKFSNWVQSVARESRTMFARDLAWQDGGKLQFTVPNVKGGGNDDSRATRKNGTNA